MTTALDLGDAMRSKALSYAAKTGTAIDLIVVQAADAKHEFSLAPNKLSKAIKANLSAEEVDSLPLPGSRWNEPQGSINNNADICQWKDPSKPGDSKSKEISFYVVWADGTPEGGNVVRELEWIKRVSTEGMVTDDIDLKWMAQYSGNPPLIKKRKKYLDGRRATVRKAYKDAVRLIWQLDMVNELQGAGADLEDGDNAVCVYNKHKPRGEWKLYSIGAFLKLNPAKASEQDGSYAALEATAKREPKGPEKGGKLSLNAVATPETSDKVATVWHSYLDKLMSDRKGANYAAYVKHLTSDNGRQAVLTLRGIQRAINGLMQMDAIKNIADIEEEKIKAAA